jgi:site-specific DNA recombinase
MSIEAQVAALKTWAEVKGWKIAGEYIDPGYTGGDDKRPELQRLMLDAGRRAFQVVAVVKIDRFMRSLRLLKNYLHDLEALDISFVAIHEGIDTSQGGTGRLLLNIMASFAEFERERIGERVRDTRGKLIEAGRWPAGKVIYGYRWNTKDRRFEVIEEEAEVVRLIFDYYVNGNIGLVQIAAKLNDGYRTRPKRTNKDKEAKPRLWYPNASNPNLVGGIIAGRWSVNMERLN